MSNLQPKYSDEHIEKYRDIHVGFDDWHDAACSSFKERMEAIGIFVDNIYFSGFWSQGDGACFEGWVQDWDKYLTHLGYTDPILIDCAINNWTYRWRHSGHYYHHKSVSYEDSVHLPDNPYTERWQDAASDDDVFRGAVWDATMAQHDLLGLVDEIQEDLEDHMQDLYRELEAEHDFLTSDEAIIEWMEANDIDPNELTEQE